MLNLYFVLIFVLNFITYLNVIFKSVKKIILSLLYYINNSEIIYISNILYVYIYDILVIYFQHWYRPPKCQKLFKNIGSF